MPTNRDHRLFTSVKGSKARADSRDADTTRCDSTHTLTRTYGPNAAGSTLHCTRPAGAHRCHESGGIQWGKGCR
jgi:hypothetical protein